MPPSLSLDFPWTVTYFLFNVDKLNIMDPHNFDCSVSFPDYTEMDIVIILLSHTEFDNCDGSTCVFMMYSRIYILFTSIKYIWAFSRKKNIIKGTISCFLPMFAVSNPFVSCTDFPKTSEYLSMICIMVVACFTFFCNMSFMLND